MTSTLSTFRIPSLRQWTIAPADREGQGLLDLYGSRSLRLVLLFALYAWPAIVVMRASLDPDIWWHLQTGRWIVDHGRVPQTDPFSAFGQDRPWLAYSWLFELIVYGLYQAFGLMGVVLYRVAMAFLVSGVLHGFMLKSRLRLLPAAGLIGATLLALSPLFNERPWMFTVVFYALTLDLVLDLRAGRARRDAWLLPVLYALWANIHIQFVYGLFVLYLACAAPWLDRLPWFKPPTGDPARAGTAAWWRLVLLAAACTAATLANPYHFRIYRVVLEYASQAQIHLLINEFFALSFRGSSDWAVLILALLSAYALGRRRTSSSFEVVLLAVAAYLSFHSRRDVWMILLAALTVLGRTQEPDPGTEVEPEGRRPIRLGATPLEAIGLGTVVSLLMLMIGWACNVTPRGIQNCEMYDYPDRATAFVESMGYGGPLFNSFNWGGYLIWKLPHLPVSMDGRTNLHGDQRILASSLSWAGWPIWKTNQELSAARLVIGPANSALSSLLRQEPRYRLVYEDPFAVVFVADQDPKVPPLAPKKEGPSGPAAPVTAPSVAAHAR